MTIKIKVASDETELENFTPKVKDGFAVKILELLMTLLTIGSAASLIFSIMIQDILIITAFGFSFIFFHIFAYLYNNLKPYSIFNFIITNYRLILQRTSRNGDILSETDLTIKALKNVNLTEETSSRVFAKKFIPFFYGIILATTGGFILFLGLFEVGIIILIVGIIIFSRAKAKKESAIARKAFYLNHGAYKIEIPPPEWGSTVYTQDEERDFLRTLQQITHEETSTVNRTEYEEFKQTPLKNNMLRRDWRIAQRENNQESYIQNFFGGLDYFTQINDILPNTNIKSLDFTFGKDFGKNELNSNLSKIYWGISFDFAGLILLFFVRTLFQLISEQLYDFFSITTNWLDDWMDEYYELLGILQIILVVKIIFFLIIIIMIGFLFLSEHSIKMIRHGLLGKPGYVFISFLLAILPAFTFYQEIILAVIYFFTILFLTSILYGTIATRLLFSPKSDRINARYTSHGYASQNYEYVMRQEKLKTYLIKNRGISKYKMESDTKADDILEQLQPAIINPLFIFIAGVYFITEITGDSTLLFGLEIPTIDLWTVLALVVTFAIRKWGAAIPYHIVELHEPNIQFSINDNPPFMLLASSAQNALNMCNEMRVMTLIGKTGSSSSIKAAPRTQTSKSQIKRKLPKYGCPTCGKPVEYGLPKCPSCLAAFNWEGVEVPPSYNDSKDTSLDLQTTSTANVVKSEPKPRKSLPKYGCPTCGKPVEYGLPNCPNCLAAFNWEGVEVPEGYENSTNSSLNSQPSSWGTANVVKSEPKPRKSLPKYGCPTCGKPVEYGLPNCPNCLAAFNWEGIEVPEGYAEPSKSNQKGTAMNTNATTTTAQSTGTFSKAVSQNTALNATNTQKSKVKSSIDYSARESETDSWTAGISQKSIWKAKPEYNNPISSNTDIEESWDSNEISASPEAEENWDSESWDSNSGKDEIINTKTQSNQAIPQNKQIFECPSCNSQIEFGLSLCPVCKAKFDWSDVQLPINTTSQQQQKLPQQQQPSSPSISTRGNGSNNNTNLPMYNQQSAESRPVFSSVKSAFASSNTTNTSNNESSNEISCPNCGEKVKSSWVSCPFCTMRLK